MDSLKLEECEVCYMGMLERKLKLNKNKKSEKGQTRHASYIQSNQKNY